jgi:hypothetical protein
MRKLRIFVSLAFFAAASSCSTIYFHNGSQTYVDHDEWHHDGIIRLVEFSSPVNLNERCEGKNWGTVKTEESFLNWLAGAFTFGIYDPWTVSYSCKQ